MQVTTDWEALAGNVETVAKRIRSVYRTLQSCATPFSNELGAAAPKLTPTQAGDDFDVEWVGMSVGFRLSLAYAGAELVGVVRCYRLAPVAPGADPIEIASFTFSRDGTTDLQFLGGSKVAVLPGSAGYIVMSVLDAAIERMTTRKDDSGQSFWENSPT